MRCGYREVFHAVEDVLCVPKVTVPAVNTAHLRVIDNDTRCEVPQLFCKVVPFLYKKNQVIITDTARV